MSKFRLRKLSEICCLIADCVNKTAPKVDYLTNYKMLRTTNIKKGYIDYENVGYVTEETFKKWTRRCTPQYGDIILTREAPVGEIGRFNKQTSSYFLGQRLFLYRPNPELLNWNYLAYTLMSPEMQGVLQGLSNGSTVSHIKVPDAEHLEIPYCHINIQNKIGKILSNYDDLIENHNNRIKILEEMAQKIYKQWFIDFKFPNHESATFKDSELGKVLMPLKGKSITKATIKNGNIPVVAGGLTPAYYHNIANTKAPVITVSASGANAGYINFYYADIWASDCSYIDSSMAKYIYYYYLLLKANQIKVTNMQRGAAQPHVYPQDLAQLKIKEFDEKIIENFENLITPIFEQIKNLSLKNKTLKQARDILLPRLISGEINVENLEIL